MHCIQKSLINNMNINKAKIIWTDYCPEECEESNINVEDITNLNEINLASLINSLLGAFPYQDKIKSKNGQIAQILNMHGFYTEDQIKEKKGIKFAEKDKFYISRYSGFVELENHQIDNFNLVELKQVVENDKVFVAVKLPIEAKNKINALIKIKEDKIKKSADKKESKKIEKAKKMLEANGMKVI